MVSKASGGICLSVAVLLGDATAVAVLMIRRFRNGIAATQKFEVKRRGASGSSND
jgi:hypothetical protein